MARDILDIKTQLKATFVDNVTLQELYGLDTTKSFDEQFSKVSIEARLIDVWAAATWMLEQIWDAFRSETEAVIDEGSVGVTKLKVYFSDAGKQPLTGDVRTSFETYMRQVGAAGTHYLFVSETPDELRVHLHVYYDALVLDSTGARLNGGGNPVEEAIEGYLNGLEYGGVMYASKLIDVIQQAEGVKDVTLDGTTWKGTLEDRRRIDAESGAFVYVRDEGIGCAD